MKIYTKTGDKGETGVVGGRLKKNSSIINTIGSFDELNASIGIVISISNAKQDYLINLVKIQNIIFYIGSVISGANIDFDFKTATKKLEQNIDTMNTELEELTKFILPGGSNQSANIHLARTICRRAERQLIEYIETFESQKPSQMKIDLNKLADIQKYTNRLSDYLFVLARYVNKRNNISDIYWDKSVD